MNLWGPIGVAILELKRSFSPFRIGTWVLMTAFPLLLIQLLLMRISPPPSAEALEAIAFFLIIRVVTVMGLLLWATPAISSEIEGRTWLYMATRPGGGQSVLLGKYLVAIGWAISSGFLAVLGVAWLAPLEDKGVFCLSMMGLVVLASMTFGATLSLIGALVQRRAMVVGMIYLVVVEGVLSAVPATLSELTVTLRLQILESQWLLSPDSPLVESLKTHSTFSLPSIVHVMILLAYTAVALGLALWRIRVGGYLTDPED